MYIANLFRNDPAASLLENLNKDTLLSFFDKKMTELLNNPKTPTNSLTSLFRVLDFGMNTRDVLSKKEYRKMIEIVKPLIYSYEKYIKESQLD